MVAATSLIPLDNYPRQLVDDNSLLQIDRELDAPLEQIEDEIEEQGEASTESMDLLRVFVEAINLKVDRIGRYVTVMETRAAYCRKEAARLTARAKRAQSKIDRTKQVVLWYLEKHDQVKLETAETTLRRQKNSQDRVIIANDAAVAADLRQNELKVDGELWVRLVRALPKDLAVALERAAAYSYQAVFRGGQHHRRRGDKTALSSSDQLTNRRETRWSARARVREHAMKELKRTMELDTFTISSLTLALTSAVTVSIFTASGQTARAWKIRGRGWMSLYWTDEFNRVHARTDWTEVDYIESVDDFYAAKIKPFVKEKQIVGYGFDTDRKALLAFANGHGEEDLDWDTVASEFLADPGHFCDRHDRPACA